MRRHSEKYGGLAAIISAIEGGVYAADRWVRAAGPELWLALAGGLVLVFWLWRR